MRLDIEEGVVCRRVTVLGWWVGKRYGGCRHCCMQENVRHFVSREPIT